MVTQNLGYDLCQDEYFVDGLMKLILNADKFSFEQRKKISTLVNDVFKVLTRKAQNDTAATTKADQVDHASIKLHLNAVTEYIMAKYVETFIQRYFILLAVVI